ncbi:replication initiator [Nonomuraea wenchangensis]|uniref:replication initiator n=1 Tax=Nonomuraea wenchangensis TaxID=568860 RepID=UPI00331F5E6D
MSSTDRHGTEDLRLGEPLCPDCYDYDASVLLNAISPELWRRFTLALRRRFARLNGMTVKTLGEQVTIAFVKVAEYQRRGVVHFHAVIRLDGPDGPAPAARYRPPPGATPVSHHQVLPGPADEGGQEGRPTRAEHRQARPHGAP